jgi:hypothetical protein
MKPPRKEFGARFSLWLDLIRLCVALMVFIFHASIPLISGGWFKVGRLGAEAVFVFFVLSGLWSVLLPALVLTYVADWIGMFIDHSPYEGWNNVIVPDGSAWRLLASALFVNELWFSSIVPMSNSPVWSHFGTMLFLVPRYFYPVQQDGSFLSLSQLSRGLASFSCFQRGSLASPFIALVAAFD